MINEANRASSACHHHRRHPVETDRPRWSGQQYYLRHQHTIGLIPPATGLTLAAMLRTILRAGLAVLVAVAAVAAEPAPADRPAIQLFNGKDLEGWDSDLASAERGQPALGHNNDPLKVFSVVTEDGEPAIRVSGQVMGGLST